MPVSDPKPPSARRPDRNDRGDLVGSMNEGEGRAGATEGYADRLRERPVEALSQQRPHFGTAGTEADEETERRGLLLVVSSPSGAGKTTLARRLLRENPDLRFSVSYTTRPRRAGEQDGVDYYYVSD